MATRLVVIGVTLLTLTVCLHPCMGFYAWLGSRHIAEGRKITVPVNGTYLVAMVAGPDGRVDMKLKVNDISTLFSAYGQADAHAGLTVVLPLIAGDQVNAVFRGNYDRNGETRLTVVLVTEGRGNFVTARGIMRVNNTPSVALYTDCSHLLVVPPHPRQTFQAGSDGMYWISARPDSGDNGLTGIVKKKLPGQRAENLFWVHCDTGAGEALSSSGAFYLSRDHLVWSYS